ncbi:MAG: DUF2142 domain-containing protein [Oscillospiraceae bacterium]|nr:DUF2142 domain-containing protein [Oscillospiraceae bacterium]
MLDKLFRFLYKIRHLLVMLCILAVMGGCLGYFYLATIVHTRDRNLAYELTYESDAQTTFFTPDTVITQQLNTNRPIYGLVIRLGKGETAPNGTLHAKIYAQGTDLLLSSVDIPLTEATIFSEYTGYMLDAPIQTDMGGAYDITFTATLEDYKDTLFLYKASRRIDYQDALYENGVEQPGILSARIIFERSGNFIDPYYWGFGGLFTLFLLLAYWFLIVKKVKPQNAFIPIALALGIFYMFILPILCVPDERTHLNTAYCYSNMFFGQNSDPHPNEVRDWRPNAWWPTEEDQTTPSIFSYKKIATQLFSKAEDMTPTEVFNSEFNDVFPVLYWPAMVGVAIARALKVGFVPLWIIGRSCNLLFFVIVTWLAIRKAPFGKSIFTTLALLPMTLHVAASFNYDAIMLAMAFYYFAYILNIAYAQPRVELRHILILAFFNMILAPSKSIYFVLMGLTLLIPLAKYKNKLYWAGANLGVWGFGMYSFFRFNDSFLAGYFYNSLEIVDASAQSLTAAVPALSTMSNSLAVQAQTLSWQATPLLSILSEMEPVLGANHYALGDLLAAPGWFIQFVLRTFFEKIWFYIQTAVGGILGYYNLPISNLWVIGFLFLLAMCLISVQNKPTPTLNASRKVLVYAVFAAFLPLMILVAFQWTSKDLTTLYGIQGRYFLPFAAPLLFTLLNNTFTCKRDLSPYIMMLACIFNIGALFNVFLVIV